jgi:hypothetical protein
MRTRQLAVTFSVAVGLFTALLPADGQTNWKVTKEFQVGGEGVGLSHRGFRRTYAVLGKIVVQPDADGIIYDRGLRRVLVVSGDGGVLMTLKPDIDPQNGKIEAKINLGGGPHPP